MYFTNTYEGFERKYKFFFFEIYKLVYYLPDSKRIEHIYSYSHHFISVIIWHDFVLCAILSNRFSLSQKTYKIILIVFFLRLNIAFFDRILSVDQLVCDCGHQKRTRSTYHYNNYLRFVVHICCPVGVTCVRHAIYHGFMFDYKSRSRGHFYKFRPKFRRRASMCVWFVATKRVKRMTIIE